MAWVRVAESTYSGDSGVQLYVEYNLLSQSASSNTSAVRIQMVGINLSSSYGSWSSIPDSTATIYLNGAAVGSKAATFDYRTVGAANIYYTIDTTIQHDANGNGSFTLGATHTTANMIGAASCSGSAALPNIARGGVMTGGVRPFNDEEDPIMSPSYTYPMGSGYTCYWWLEYDPINQGNRNIEVSVNPVNNPWDWHLTEAQRNDIRRHAKNTNRMPVRIGYQVKNGQTVLSTDYRDFYVDIVSADPSAPAITVADTNSTTTALTGSSAGRAIKGYSNLRATVSAKAVGKKYATISRYTISNGAKSLDVAESSAAVSGTINAVQSGTVTVKAVDSRGNTAQTSKTLTLIDYSPIVLKSLTLSRSGGVGTAVTLSFSGYMWAGSFGAVSNAVSSLTYRYRIKGTTAWTTGYTSLNRSTSGTTISGTTSIGNFDASKNYEFQLTIADKLSSSVIEQTLGVGQPSMKITNSGVVFKKDGLFLEDTSGVRKMILDVVYPVGSVYISVNGTNPATLFGGSWTELQGRFLLGRSSTHSAGSTGGTEKYNLRALIGAGNNNINQLSYFPTARIFTTYNTQMNMAGSAASSNKDTINHTTPVINADESGINNGTVTTTIMPPYQAVYMWKRTA